MSSLLPGCCRYSCCSMDWEGSKGLFFCVTYHTYLIQLHVTLCKASSCSLHWLLSGLGSSKRHDVRTSHNHLTLAFYSPVLFMFSCSIILSSLRQRSSRFISPFFLSSFRVQATRFSAMVWRYIGVKGMQNRRNVAYWVLSSFVTFISNQNNIKPYLTVQLVVSWIVILRISVLNLHVLNGVDETCSDRLWQQMLFGYCSEVGRRWLWLPKVATLKW